MNATTRRSKWWHPLPVGAFVVAPSLLSVLDANPTFALAHHATSGDLAVLGLLASFLPGLVVGVICWSALLVRRKQSDVIVATGVGALIGLALLPVARSLHITKIFPVVVLLGAAAIIAAVAYLRSQTFRESIAWLTPIAIVLPLLFVVLPKLRNHESSQTGGQIPVGAARKHVPVVLLVFDELPLTTLLDRNGQIDRQRYPAFARLAERATWYPNTTSVASFTHMAVPAIFSGRNPTSKAPLLSDYPLNVFTMLAGSHRLHVVEPISELCPRDLCDGIARLIPLQARLSLLLEDSSIVYLHMALPVSELDRLPPITDRWSGFRYVEPPADDEPVAAAPGGPPAGFFRDQYAMFKTFLQGINAHEPVSMHAIHSILPHEPWRYLPTGQTYSVPPINMILPPAGSSLGGRSAIWPSDENIVRDAYRRHALQVGFCDHMLGQLLDRLEATGQLDEAVVAVVADHGVSFRAGEERRLATAATIGDIARVPFFVKASRQQTPRVVETETQTIDVLPTIAALVEAPPPLTTEGAPNGKNGRALQLANAPAEIMTIDRTAIALPALLARKLEQLGDGPFEDMFKVGVRGDLVGKAIEELKVTQANAPQVSIDQTLFLATADPSAHWQPAVVTGRLSPPPTEPFVMGIVINGRLAATQPITLGDATFETLIPWTWLRRGQNELRFVRTDRDVGSPLSELPLLGVSFSLAGDELAASTGLRTKLSPGVVVGAIDKITRTHDLLTISGWAVDAGIMRPASRVVLTANGTSVATRSIDRLRVDVAARFQAPPIAGCGFSIDVPSWVLAEMPNAEYRVVALTQDGKGSELLPADEAIAAQAALGVGVTTRLPLGEAPLWGCVLRGEELMCPPRAAVRLGSASVQGHIDYADTTTEPGRVIIGGWAAVPSAKRPAGFALLILDGRVAAVAPTNVARQDVAQALGIPSLLGSGFDLRVPTAAFRRARRVQVIVATSDTEAIDLRSGREAIIDARR